MKFYKFFSFSSIVLILLIFLSSCTKKRRQETTRSYKEQVKLEQYMVNGQRSYKLYCAHCHQEDGSGLKKLMPPLKNADFISNNLEETICIIKNGAKGEMIVNGENYNLVMPPNRFLKDIEVAELTTFIYNTWADGDRLVSIEEVQEALNKCEP